MVSQNQCDQIGRFLKDLDYKFSIKKLPKYLTTFEKWTFLFKTLVDSFWAITGKIGLLLTSTSSHTGQNEPIQQPAQLY